MSMLNYNSECFVLFSGSTVVLYVGLSVTEMLKSFGFVLIIAGFVLGLIRLMGLKDG